MDSLGSQAFPYTHNYCVSTINVRTITRIGEDLGIEAMHGHTCIYTCLWLAVLKVTTHGHVQDYYKHGVLCMCVM